MADNPHGDYFGRPDKDSYTLIRVKRAWLPDWTWRIVARIDPHGEWLAHWLSVEAASSGA